MEQVILVNELDEELGTMEKLEAHEAGALHRAFSVLLFNKAGEVLLQKRASHKYHSGGQWTNTCCSHPRPNETVSKAVERRLLEEMGIKAECKFKFKFHYNASFDNGLIEHELDHVFVGLFDGVPVLNPEEAEDWKYVSLGQVKQDIALKPDEYTVWFRLIVEQIDRLQVPIFA